ncbi:hypothetical protein BOX15_Mlig019035g2 [Macrostomum lignano]|nr:hypothetical protein BOX15_Mlig019035g2 [Macrostomum lignano]
MALEDSRANAERLHRDSELVVSNVNTWVADQKAANEKLGKKIREQSRAIAALQQERDKLADQAEQLRGQLGQAKPVDLDKFRALQSHSAQQQALLNQLRTRLHDCELGDTDRAAALEELHGRLRDSTDSVSRLNQQINQLQKENRQLRSELERERLAAQSYRVQAESRDQTVGALKAQLEARAFQVFFDDQAAANLGLSNVDREKIRSAVESAMKEAGVSDASQLDKNYWISRCSELSGQLQRSGEYWGDKVRELSARLERASQADASKQP